MKLSRQEKAFADELLNDPKKSAPQAWIATHKTNNPKSAKVQAHRALTRPNLQAYLAAHDQTAQNTVIEIMSNSGRLKDEPAHAAIALKAADSVLDRLHGKATQRVETHSTSVNLNLDLTAITSKE